MMRDPASDRSSSGTGPASSGPAFIRALRFRSLTPAYDWIVRLTTRERAVKRALLEMADLRSASRLLDVGSGTGTFAIEAKRRYPQLEVVGVELDADILGRARAKASRAEVEVRFVGGSATALPLPDSSFDRVTSSLVFHHLTSDQKRSAAREIARVLLPGGQLHMADWTQPANALMRLLFTSVQLRRDRDHT